MVRYFVLQQTQRWGDLRVGRNSKREHSKGVTKVRSKVKVRINFKPGRVQGGLLGFLEFHHPPKPKQVLA